MSLISFVAMFSWIGFSVLSIALDGHTFLIPSLSQEQSLLVWQTSVMAVMFVIVEIIIPWLHGGSTIGGSFVRMTCETKERTRGYRIFFYAMRTLTIVVALVLSPLMFPALAIYYLAKRCMPYDMIASQDNS